MIELHSVTKKYEQFHAIRSVSLTVEKGEIHGIIGASGAGKSTLLRLMNVLERPDDGDVQVNGQLLTKATPKQLRDARKSIGMIFQQFNLVSNKTVYANVLLSLELAKYPKADRRKRVLECLDFVGLVSMVDKYPAQLSGGQKQRVAIARALANHPQVLLCDEPTSSLDPHTTAEVLTVLETIHIRLGVTIVIVSHELDVIKSICNRVSVMADGTIHETIAIQPKGIQVTTDSPSHLLDQLKKDGVPNA